MIKIGDKYKITFGEDWVQVYILAQVGKEYLALLNIETGHCWTLPVKVKNFVNVEDIEFDIITDGQKFEYVSSYYQD